MPQALRVQPFTPRPWAPGSVVMSGLAHTLLVLLLVFASREETVRPTESILPALYLYAPDHQPSTMRVERVPLPAPPGTPLGGRSSRLAVGDGHARLAPVADTGLRKGLGAKGRLPPGPESVTLDSVFSVLEVDSEVVRFAGSGAPAYPSALLQEGVEGEVQAEFVVDTTGRVDLRTIRVVWSSHREFTVAVEQALGEMLFRPAVRGRQRVRQLVQQRFVFRLARPEPLGTNL